MDAGQDALHPLEPPLLGAVPAGEVGDLGVISPELALVDPELARRARELLPEPRERPGVQRPPAPLPVSERPAEREDGHRRRSARMLALAIAIFVAGATSGTLLGNHQTGSSASGLEVRVLAPATSETTAARPALLPPRLTPTKTVAASPRHRRHARVVWAPNVLGVEAAVGRDGVALQWKAPAGSARVVVLRRRNGGSGSTVVYRGRAARLGDASVRRCTSYRYTIVNYDRRGHRSTGVPTSVVTRCA